eukprot:TRINITY_DN65600_c0_g1_i1.p1 TRINITY_DN65600_c0_g1~~TRINITY_DN65600_c0_g1_i1.p1  ORF type:complete len:547 (+),score=56.09 TRINITY_DN65600_c0_g1_i1:31-1641(+)
MASLKINFRDMSRMFSPLVTAACLTFLLVTSAADVDADVDHEDFLGQIERNKLLMAAAGIAPKPLRTVPASLLEKREHRLESAAPVDMNELYLQTVRYALVGELGHTPAAEGQPYDATERSSGRNGCRHCLTLVGMAALHHHGMMALDLWQRGIPGDMMEAGTWHGGVSIYTAALALVYPHLASGRKIFLADTFYGIPTSSSAASQTYWNSLDQLNVGGRKTVEANFRRFGLYSSQVDFIEGAFAFSLPKFRESYLAQGRRLAMLRLDVDMYESYVDALYNLYDLVSPGGYVVCDDCRCEAEADRAILAFMHHHSLSTDVHTVPGSSCGIFWRKEGEVVLDRMMYADWNPQRLEASTQSACNIQAGRSIMCMTERFMLHKMEHRYAKSHEDLELVCSKADNLVLLWEVPLPEEVWEFSDVQLTSLENAGEALRPSPLSHCARIVVADFGLGTDLRSQEDVGVEWTSEKGAYMALSVACGPHTETARFWLKSLFGAFRRETSGIVRDAHLASTEQPLRSFLADVAACHTWAEPGQGR